MDDLTQENVNKAFKLTKEKWDSMRAEFTGSDVLFIMSRDAMDFLGQYEIIREKVIGEGFNLPPLDDKVKVTLS